MNRIALLSQETIDKIAAGEVVERPASVVKELVENAIDAGANAITAEIRDGGLSLIRITDNGCGIPKDEVRAAFLRHATSKIRTADDLMKTGTLGFRGEALSSIAAVCQVEMITKTADSLLGVRYVIEGGAEQNLEEIGAPGGTTFLVRNIFYHTPARKKFLKSAVTEAGYVSDLLERLALSHPEVSFKFISNRDIKLRTSGNGKQKDIIYSVFGREIAANVVPVDAGAGAVHITGFIGKPVISRGNRNYENYFVNGRYVKNAIIAKAIEEAYRPFLMSHRYPFTVLMLQIDTEQVDVNVHPTKMEVRFASQSGIYDRVLQAVREGLLHRELIPEFTIEKNRVLQGGRKTAGGIAGETAKIPGGQEGISPQNGTAQTRIGEPEKSADPSAQSKEGTAAAGPDAFARKNSGTSGYRDPEPFERVRSQLLAEAKSPYEPKYPGHPSHYAQHRPELRPVTGTVTNHPEENVITGLSTVPEKDAAAAENSAAGNSVTSENGAGVNGIPAEENGAGVNSVLTAETCTAGCGVTNAGGTKESGAMAEENGAGESLTPADSAVKPRQLELFDDRLLAPQNAGRHRLIGQIFGTYWIVEFQDKMYIIDQHAAHEKVLYERFMKRLAEKKQTSQIISPPVIVTLSMQEEEMLLRHMDRFTETGFVIEPFGGREYSVSAVPGNLYGIAERTLFVEILDGLTDIPEQASQQAVRERIASMSCKAAVKGNHKLQPAEAEALIAELLTLDNPYNCPHGRPTIIAMTKYDLEKKFKRIV